MGSACLCASGVSVGTETGHRASAVGVVSRRRRRVEHTQAPRLRGRSPSSLSMATTITEDAEGKTVVHDGETVGVVTEVDHGTAYVEPDPGVTEKLRGMLGWSDDDEAYPLQESAIDRVTDDEIRLRSTF